MKKTPRQREFLLLIAIEDFSASFLPLLAKLQSYFSATDFFRSRNLCWGLFPVIWPKIYHLATVIVT
jgi:hypothetical protein